jgi:hypothetical protein
MSDLLTGIAYLSFSIAFIALSLFIISFAFREKSPGIAILIALLAFGIAGASAVGGLNAVSGAHKIINEVQALSKQDASATNK